jgi:hypothetical protein
MASTGSSLEDLKAGIEARLLQKSQTPLEAVIAEL